MSLPALLESPPDNLSVLIAPGEITIQTTMASGPGAPWQNIAGAAAMLLLLSSSFGFQFVTWMWPATHDIGSGFACAGFLLCGMLFVLSAMGRSGGPLTIRGNTLVATRYSVQLDQIRTAKVKSYATRNSPGRRYGLWLYVPGKKLTWSMPDASKEQAEWVCAVVNAAVAAAKPRAGTAAEVPAALRALQATPAQQ